MHFILKLLKDHKNFSGLTATCTPHVRGEDTELSYRTSCASRDTRVIAVPTHCNPQRHLDSMLSPAANIKLYILLLFCKDRVLNYSKFMSYLVQFS